MNSLRVESIEFSEFDVVQGALPEITLPDEETEYLLTPEELQSFNEMVAEIAEAVPESLKEELEATPMRKKYGIAEPIVKFSKK